MKTRRFSREEILQKAVELIDQEGLSKLSMRRLASDLGIEAMSLYNYFSDKQELLNGMHEIILAEIDLSNVSGSWKEQIFELSHAFCRVLRKHPHAIPLYTTTPAMTMRSLQYLDRGYSILREVGLGEIESLYAFQNIYLFIIGHMNWYYANPHKVSVSEEQLKEFPLLHKAMTAQAFSDKEAEFNYGLESLLVGLENKIKLSRRD